MQNNKKTYIAECLQIKWYMVFLVAFNSSHVKYSIQSDTFLPLKSYYLLHDEHAYILQREKSMILLHKLMQFSARFHFRFFFFISSICSVCSEYPTHPNSMFPLSTNKVVLFRIKFTSLHFIFSYAWAREWNPTI